MMISSRLLESFYSFVCYLCEVLRFCDLTLRLVIFQLRTAVELWSEIE